MSRFIFKVSGVRSGGAIVAGALLALSPASAVAQDVVDVAGWTTVDSGDIDLFPTLSTRYEVNRQDLAPVASLVDTGNFDDEVTWQQLLGANNEANEDYTDGISCPGFDFKLFGQEFDEVYLSANGRLLFNDPSDVPAAQRSDRVRETLEDPTLGNADYSIAVYWQDLDLSGGENGEGGSLGANVFGSKAVYKCFSDHLILEWYQVPNIQTRLNGCGEVLGEDGGHITFQARLNANGSVELRYIELDFMDAVPEFSTGGSNTCQENNPCSDDSDCNGGTCDAFLECDCSGAGGGGGGSCTQGGVCIPGNGHCGAGTCVGFQCDCPGGGTGTACFDNTPCAANEVCDLGQNLCVEVTAVTADRCDSEGSDSEPWGQERPGSNQLETQTCTTPADCAVGAGFVCQPPVVNEFSAPFCARGGKDPNRCDVDDALATCPEDSACLDLFSNGSPLCVRNDSSFGGNSVIGIRGQEPNASASADPTWVVQYLNTTSILSAGQHRGLTPRLRNGTRLTFTPILDVVEVEWQYRCDGADFGNGDGQFPDPGDNNIGVADVSPFNITWDTTDPTPIVDRCFGRARACRTGGCGAYFPFGPIHLRNNNAPEVTDISGYFEAPDRNTGVVTFEATVRDDDAAAFGPAAISGRGFGNFPNEPFDPGAGLDERSWVLDAVTDLVDDDTEFATGKFEGETLFRNFGNLTVSVLGVDEELSLRPGIHNNVVNGVPIKHVVDFMDGMGQMSGQILRVQIDPADNTARGDLDVSFGGVFESDDTTQGEVRPMNRDFGGGNVRNFEYITVSDFLNPNGPKIAIMMVPSQEVEHLSVDYDLQLRRNGHPLEPDQLNASVNNVTLPLTLYMAVSTETTPDDMARFFANDLVLGPPPPGTRAAAVDFELLCDGVNVCASGTDNDPRNGFSFAVDFDALGEFSDDASIRARATDGIETGEDYQEDGLLIGGAIPSIADAGAGYVVPFGHDLELDGSSSTPSQGGSVVTNYDWDLDNDGVAETPAAGPELPLDWEDIQRDICGGECVEGQIYVIGLQVIDDTANVSAIATTTVTIEAREPPAPITISPDFVPAPADCTIAHVIPACDTSGLPADRDTITVGASGDFQTISDAVQSLPLELEKPTVVMIEGGVYEERVRVANVRTTGVNKLWIMARCTAGVRDQVTIDGGTLPADASRREGFEVLSVNWLVLDGLRVTDHEGDGLKILGSSHVVARAISSWDNGETGIRVGGSDRVTVESSRSYANGSFGLLSFKSDRTRLLGNNTWNNGDSGVMLWGSRNALIDGHRSINNGEGNADNDIHGVAVAFGSDNADIRGSALCGNGQMGIFVTQSRGARVVGNRLEGNRLHGVAGYDSADDMRIQCNLLGGSGEFGAHVRAAVGARIMHNQVLLNAKGIVASGGASLGLMHNNMVRGNTESGITAAWGATDWDISNNSILDGDENGMEIMNGSGRARVTDNIIHGNRGTGMFQDGGSSNGSQTDYNLWYNNGLHMHGAAAMGPNALMMNPRLESDGTLRGDSPARGAGSRKVKDAGLERGRSNVNDSDNDSDNRVNMGYHVGMCQ